MPPPPPDVLLLVKTASSGPEPVLTVEHIITYVLNFELDMHNVIIVSHAYVPCHANFD